MIGWTGAGEWDAIRGLPHVTKIIRKPTSVGAEIKNLCCGGTKIMLAIELQEGKEAMATKEFREETNSAGTAVLLRLCKTNGLLNTHRCVIADSAFASVKTAVACRDHGLHFRGIVKTATTLFPKQYFGAKSMERGETETLVATKGESTLIAHAWQDKTKKTFISTCGRTTLGSDHVRKRVIADTETGEQKTVLKKISRTELVQEYFQNAIGIDVHNHVRSNIGLEEVWGTWMWWKRIFAGILGMIITDAYLAYKFDVGEGAMTRYLFMEQLANEMCSNKIKRGHCRFSKRKASSSVEDVLETEVYEEEGHAYLPLLEHIMYSDRKKKQCNKNGSSQVKCPQRTCSVCQKLAGYFCKTCSSKEGKLVVLCGPLTKRDCSKVHEQK
jgi:hypothetical protein